MFQFTQELSSGIQSQCLAKITGMVHCACQYERCVTAAYSDCNEKGGSS